MDEINQPYFSFASSKMWIKAVIIESEEILRIHNQTTRLFKDLFNSPREEMDHYSDLRSIHEYYLIIALNKAREWIVEASKHDNDLLETLKEIDCQLPSIRDVRNMREHEIEYFYNKGNKQKSFIKPVDTEGNIIADATSTVVTSEGYFVGGRINVQKSLDLFRLLYQMFEIKMDELNSRDMNNENF